MRLARRERHRRALRPRPLPAQAQAAVERIDLLAHAARRAGHPSTLDQIRVDILAGLLDGTLHHLDRDQIIAHLLTHRSGNDDPPAPRDDRTTHDGADTTKADPQRRRPRRARAAGTTARRGCEARDR